MYHHRQMTLLSDIHLITDNWCHFLIFILSQTTNATFWYLAYHRQLMPLSDIQFITENLCHLLIFSISQTTDVTCWQGQHTQYIKQSFSFGLSIIILGHTSVAPTVCLVYLLDEQREDVIMKVEQLILGWGGHLVPIFVPGRQRVRSETQQGQCIIEFRRSVLQWDMQVKCRTKKF